MAKRITIKDVAKEAGVSVALVSFVMNNRLEANGKQKYRVGESTRARILEVARRMEYNPAVRVLPRKRLVGMILPERGNPSYDALADEVERLILPQGCTLIFGYTQGNPIRFERLTELLVSKKLDGLVIVPPENGEDWLEPLRSAGIPFVIPNSSLEAVPAAAECASRLLQLMQEQ